MNPMCPFSHSISVKRSTRCDTRIWLVNSPGSIYQMKSTDHLLSQRPLSCDELCGADVKYRLHQCQRGAGLWLWSFIIGHRSLRPASSAPAELSCQVC